MAYVSQVVAIVMDLLTDLQILQDLLDAASKRSVAVYIILDSKGAPHFLDMCSRLMVGPQHLQVSGPHREELLFSPQHLKLIICKL